MVKLTHTLGQDLLILEECTWPPLTETPSWVPDWTHREHHRLFGGSPKYNASSGVLPSLCIDPVGRLLRCEGISLGTVDGLGATCYDGEPSIVPTDSLCQPHHDRNPYGTADNLRAAIWQVLVGNRTPTGTMAPKAYECLLQCAIATSTGRHDAVTSWRGRRTFNGLMRANGELRICGRTLRSFFPHEAHSKSDPIGARDALERMFRFWRARRLLVTDEGRLGAGPAATLPGDGVFTLLGSTVPVVLRPSANGTYQVVGCCYLQDFMEGEALQEVQGETRVLRSVVIS